MTDKEQGNSDYLKQPRDPGSKYFSFDQEQLAGKSMQEKYKEDVNFRAAHELHKKCTVYALAYTEVMLNRAKAEDPEIFAKKGMSKSEMQAHMVHNMCLNYSKVQAKMFRERTASIYDEQYLKDNIRRLNNGGDKFHPYM